RAAEAGELFEKIASLGYNAVEIAVEDPALIDIPTVRAALAANRLEAIICGAFGPTRDLTSDDSQLQRTGLDYIEACLDITSALGARFFAGPMYSAVGKARMVPPAQRTVEWERAVANLRTVCASAASRGLEIALEP